MGNLLRADPIAQHGAALQGPAMLESVEQRSPEGIATAGRIDDFGGFEAGNVLATAVLPNFATVGAERHDDPLEP